MTHRLCLLQTLLRALSWRAAHLKTLQGECRRRAWANHKTQPPLPLLTLWKELVGGFTTWAAVKKQNAFFFFFFCSQIAVPSKAFKSWNKTDLASAFYLFFWRGWGKGKRTRKLIKPVHSLGVVYKAAGTESIPLCCRDPLAVECDGVVVTCACVHGLSLPVQRTGGTGRGAPGHACPDGKPKGMARNNAKRCVEGGWDPQDTMTQWSTCGHGRT